MGTNPEYEIIVSDRARQMLVSHVGFLVQKSPSAARKTKDELLVAIRSLSQMLERFPFLEADFIPINTTKCMCKNGISFYIKLEIK